MSATIGRICSAICSVSSSVCWKSTVLTLSNWRARSCDSPALRRASRRTPADRTDRRAERRGARPCLRSRTDAATGGADLLFAALILAREIERRVIRQDQLTRRTDAQAFAHRHTDAFELGDLAHQCVRRQHHAIADQALHVRPQDAGRNQVQDRLHAVDDQRVPGVVAALKAHHRGDVLGEQIDDLAFAFVTPLGADHDHVATHCSSRLSSPCFRV